MGIRAKGRLASIAAAGLLLWMGVPAQAACAGSDCATTSAASERTKEAGEPVALSKFTKRTARHSAAARKAIEKKYATKRAAKYARVAAKVQKAARKFTAASVTQKAVTPKTVADEGLKPSIANARAEMSENEIRAAGLIVDNPPPAEGQLQSTIEVAAADQLNDIDRAASADSSGPKTVALKTVALKTTAQPVNYDRQITASSADTWDQTSLIGKIFVAFGGLLTLASAARLFIA